MFTGIIKDIGQIQSIRSNREGRLFEIKTALTNDIKVDDSVALNGVCQTAIKVMKDSFLVQAVTTTLAKTTLSDLKLTDKVNLELALRPVDRMGGHIVSGHVNTIGRLADRKIIGNNHILRISMDSMQMKYVIDEGSICLDGISLTVSRVLKNRNEFEVSIIPHTLKQTTLEQKKLGEGINIEVDILSKYLENFYLSKQREEKKQESYAQFFNY